jgi:hypothetical protein
MSYPNAPNTNAIAEAIRLIQVGMPQALLTFCSTMITASASPQAVTPASMLGITTGMTLNVDVSNQEAVTVTSTTVTTFSAVFAKNHGLNGAQWTIGTGSLNYSFVKLGYVTDPTDVTTYCAITFLDGTTKRKASGWRIEDRPRFMVESGFDMTDGTAAEQALMTTRDVLLPIYFAQISLNATPGVYLTLMDQPDKAVMRPFPNGRIYRAHLFMVQAANEYNIAVSN